MKKITILVLVLLNVSVVQAATVKEQGAITEVYHYGSGMVLVLGPKVIEGSSAGCNGASQGFVVPHDYPKMEQLMSIVLTAKATGSNVVVHSLDIPDSCWAPTFTNSSVFRLQ
jgi:hypothetical protein